MSEHPLPTTQSSLDSLNNPRSLRKWAKKAWVHITKHVGVGIICSVAYFDPYASFFHPSLETHTQSSSQWKLGCRFTSRLRIWIQTLICRSIGRSFCGYSSGKFNPISPPVTILFSLLSKGLACKLGVVTGLGASDSFVTPCALV